MNDPRTFQIVTGAAAILSAPLAFASLLVGLIALDFNMEAFGEPRTIIHVVTRANLLRLSVLLNLFGYYVLWLPSILWLWIWLGPKRPAMTRLYSLCGLGYIALGATGGAILSSAWPPLIHAYAQASASEREVLALTFSAITTTVEGGIWSTPQNFFHAVWWLGMGGVLRGERHGLGTLTLVLGAFALLNSVGEVFDVEAFDMAGLFVTLLMGPIWHVWLGLVVLSIPLSHVSSLMGSSSVDR
ncbi:hypothetical protein [Candidatus Entotheonella palauensis]|uniref:hypothetical protein n=1 Tax=Candidatus Entotheonella palauensis TaxID=93172 RepID=UPI000B7FBA9F|nr:hypothetical protein [Candidatus Entotheonella palauensis]